MKRKFLAFCVICFILIGNISVCAEKSLFKSVNVDYDRENGVVEIEGEITLTERTDILRLMVLKPDTDLKKLAEGSISFVDYGVYAEETKAINGKFSFETFKLSDTMPVGNYILRIVVDDEIYEGKVSHATKTQTLSLLNNAENTEELLGLIELYNDVYQLSVSEDDLFSKLGEDGKAYVLGKVCEGTFSDFDALNSEFNKNTALYKINIGPWGSLEKVLTENETLLSLDLDSFNNLSQTQKDDVCKALVGNLFEDGSALNDKIEEETEKVRGKNNSGTQRPSGGGGNGGGTQINLGSATQTEINKPDNSEKITFVDLGGFDWAKDGIHTLYEKGIINGRGNGIFAPGDFVTRAEAVKMVVIALGMEGKESSSDFIDVSENSWMYPYVSIAAKSGVISGYGNGYFGATDKITREDLVTVITRALESEGKVLDYSKEEVIFNDADNISGYALSSVNKMQMAGVINGDGNYFYPKNFATRAETAKIIASIID